MHSTQGAGQGRAPMSSHPFRLKFRMLLLMADGGNDDGTVVDLWWKGVAAWVYRFVHIFKIF